MNLALITRTILLLLLVCPAFAQMTVVNAASFDRDDPLASGSFATIFGQNLCGQTAAGQLNSGGMYPLLLGGCSVNVNGATAMLQYVSSGQINFVVPQNMTPGSASLIVNNGSQTISGSMMTGAAGPGVFTLDGTGMGNGAMLHSTLWRMGPFSAMTNGQPTSISIFVTGLDLSEKPVVTVGGMAVEVTFYGNAPGYPGLQQINITLPGGMAGVGRVPVTVTSNGQTSNVVFVTMLPTTAMMQGMPGWGPGMMIGDNMPRGTEMSYLSLNPANNTALVTDEAGDALRVISLASKATLATITLPDGSEAHSVAVNSAGTLAAVALTEKGSVAVLDLAQNQVKAVIGSGYYASHLAFAGSALLVTNSASGTVAVIDTNALQVVRTVNVGFGPSGIAVAGNLAVVANMQEGSVSIINLNDFSVTNVALPAGSRPHEVAISTAANKAVITNPMYNSVFVLSLDTREVKRVDTSFGSGMGPGAVAAYQNVAYIANQMTASVSVLDLSSGTVVRTFPVDPGPRALAVNAAKNQLVVLCEGTGTLDLVDLATYAVTDRINATAGNRIGAWTLPVITSISPASAKAGDSFTLAINGSQLQGVSDVEFLLTGYGMGGGMMGGYPAMGDDPNIKVTNVRVDASGSTITASVQILPAAAPGARQVRLETDHGGMMGMMSGTLFTVAK